MSQQMALISHPLNEITTCGECELACWCKMSPDDLATLTQTSTLLAPGASRNCAESQCCLCLALLVDVGNQVVAVNCPDSEALS